ncbi:MAG TPA: sigma-70 family RNA polymerase sigma factor [Gemmataceae bacterium]|jgi:cyanophycinase
MTATVARVFCQVQRWASVSRGGDASDAVLLDRFIRHRDETAFTALVARHGPMVLHVCHRVLGDAHEAEDAFQAAFLLLARKAHSLKRPEALSGWLYGVARRVALKARTKSAGRSASPTALDEALLDPRPDPLARLTARELLDLLDEEVQRLPETQRSPVVLCCLEGRTQEEAARILGATPGAIKGRLERGRQRLHARLARRGIALPAALAVVAVAHGPALSVPAMLQRNAVRAVLGGAVNANAATLADSVLQGMAASKLLGVATVVLTMALTASAVALMYRAPAAERADNNPPAAPVAAEDNVLGLPKPRDARRPGAVVLHGGGRITDSAFDRFVALAGGQRARLVLVPSAGFRPRDYDNNEQFLAVMRRRFSSWVRLASTGQVARFEFLCTDDPDDADDAAFVRPLETATGVWFSGGFQTRLNYRFVGSFPRQTKFQAALRGVLERGGVVGGTSAGMAALPQIMTLRQDQRRTDGPLSAVAGHGLGLLTGAIVEQHFDGRNGRLERFTDLLRDGPQLDKLSGRGGAGANMLGLAVEEGTALVARADRLEVVGDRAAHVFLKSPGDVTIVWHTLGSGGKAALKRNRRGEVTLTREAPPH